MSFARGWLMAGVMSLVAVGMTADILAGEKCFQWVVADYESYCAYAALDCDTNQWTVENWMPPWTSLPGACGCSDPNCIPPSKDAPHKPGDIPNKSKRDPRIGTPPLKPGNSVTIDSVKYFKLMGVKNKANKNTTRIIKVVTLTLKVDGTSLPTTQAWETDDQVNIATDPIIPDEQHKGKLYKVKFTGPDGTKYEAMLAEHPNVP